MEKYCRECGTLLISKFLDTENAMIPFCPTCGKYCFPSFNTAVSMIVRDIATKDILLIKQYGRDFYILVAGYVNKTEALEHAVVREVKEETGMDVISLFYNRSEYFKPSNTLMCNFTVWVNKEMLHVNSEIDSYSWFHASDAKSNIKKGSLAEKFLLNYLSKEDE